MGALVGHGLIFGFAERGSAVEVRGRRLLCSSRGRRRGCGRTWAVWLSAVVPGRTVRAHTIFGLLCALSQGIPGALAWRALSQMSARTGYRTAARLALAGPTIRTQLLSRGPPPASPDTRVVDAQLLAHLRAVLGEAVASFDAYQLEFQRSVFS